MSLINILKPELVIANLATTSKKRTLENIANLVADRLHCDKEAVFDALLAREKLGSTGVGQGIAVPHCRLEEANHIAMVVISLEKAIDFDAIDRKKVDLIFALIVPPQECDHHLTTLGQIAEFAQSPEKLESLRQADSNQALYDTFKSLL